MKNDSTFPKKRATAILDAAADQIVRYGYKKITMSDIAEAAGVTRAIVYQHFDSKDSLFEALLLRETQRYYTALLEGIEHDPDGGTLAGAFRSALAAVRRSPFLSALMKRDRSILGAYVSKPGNLYAPIQSDKVWVGLLEAMQAVGAVRQDIQPRVFAYILNALALGMITIGTDPETGDAPAFEDIIEAIAVTMDRALTPNNGGDRKAGKVILQQLVSAGRSQLEQEHKTIHE